MELAGLEPATSWVRFLSHWGLKGTGRDGYAVFGLLRELGFPFVPRLYSPQLTTLALQPADACL
jgi:hypothetical protein